MCSFGKECGGVALYIREDMNCKLVDLYSGSFDGSPEFLILEVPARQMSTVLVGVVYRAPRLNLTRNVWSFFSRLFTCYPYSIIMGDLNINLLNKKTPDSRHLMQQA